MYGNRLAGKGRFRQPEIQNAADTTLILPMQLGKSQAEFSLGREPDNSLLHRDGKRDAGVLKLQLHSCPRNHGTLTTNPAAANRQVLDNPFLPQLMR